MDLRNRGDAMRMRYERPPRWGGSEERIGRDNDAEGLCVKVGSPHPGPTGRCGGPAANHLDDYGGTAVLTGCSDSRVQGEKVKNTYNL